MLCAFAAPEIAKASLPEVAVEQIRNEDVTESIICSGIIQEKDNERLSFDVPIYPSTVNVNEGDTVKKGDLLLSVDKAHTASVLASTAGIRSNLSGMNITTELPEALYAPVSGTVTSVNVKEGKMTSPSTTLLTIAGDDSMEVVVQVGENRIAEVETGQDVIISGTGFKNKNYNGVIKEISSEAKQIAAGGSLQTVVDVTISIKDADEKLKPGFTSKAEIITKPAAAKLLVPYEAVNQDAHGNEFVYIWQNGAAHKRIIKTGNEYQDGFETLEGLQAGEYIIKNAEKINKDGAYVKAVQEGDLNT